MEEKTIVTYFRHQTDYRALFLAYEQEVIKCSEWIEKCESLEQQLQLKDKMIELMAKDKIRYLINCKGFPETYLTKAKKDNFNCITNYYKEQALAELEE